MVKQSLKNSAKYNFFIKSTLLRNTSKGVKMSFKNRSDLRFDKIGLFTLLSSSTDSFFLRLKKPKFLKRVFTALLKSKTVDLQRPFPKIYSMFEGHKMQDSLHSKVS